MPRSDCKWWEPGVPSYQKFDKRKYEVCEIYGCWIWFGEINNRQRPRLTVDGKTVLAYKYFWELENGPVPKNKELDHVVCDNPICVNPNHLALTTRRKNAARTPYQTSQWRQELRGIPF